MELWVRSQDRETMLPNPILIVDYNRILTPKNDYRDTHLILGHYKTKERALEVLDEIQEILLPKVKIIHNKVECSKLANYGQEIITQPMASPSVTSIATPSTLGW